MKAQPSKRRSSICGYRPRLFGYAVVLIAIGVPVTAGAVLGVVSSPPGLATVLGVVIFLGLTLLAELKPVPLDENGSRLVSLAFIFVVSSQILFGWEYGILISAVALFVAQVTTRTPALRTVFNASVYAVSAFVASIPSLTFLSAPQAFEDARFGPLTALSFLEGSIFVGLNVVLVCIAIAFHEGTPVRPVIANHLKHSGPAFAIMGFITALAVALWTVWPPLLILLAGPLFALALFQRYALRTKLALHAAATDSLTHLKNHRSYEADLRTALAEADSNHSEVGLCLVDIDDFKKLNDRHGHPIGDLVLITFADKLAGLGGGVEAYRLGGDEFALIARGERRAVDAIEALKSELSTVELPHGGELTFGAGIASYPASADTAEELLRVADVALYWTKRHGKNRWCVYTPSVVEVSWPAELAATVEYDARLRAAENLIKVVDARDTYTGSHSQSVAVLVAAIGEALGISEEMAAQLRLAGLLHDLGKIAVPDAILQKPGHLDPSELVTLRRHPQTGFDLLQGLDVNPVDFWILHHHEHWDGSGYPKGLRAEEIPIGSRIILVADAFDAMTTERRYRRAVSVETALEELRRYAGTQFDPEAVAALERALEHSASRIATEVA